MQDRVPLYPGRVKLTPVSGQQNTYDMVRADEPTQEGDPLNKSTLLKDATAALFGLDATAVPDDVLNVLSRFQNCLGNEYLWEKSDETGVVGYVNSPDPNAYPPAVSDGYTYTALGQLGNKVKIATVSYTGTGIKGDKEIIFPVVPNIVFVSRGDGASMYIPYIWGEAFLFSISASSSSFSKHTYDITVSGTTLTAKGNSTLVNGLDVEGVTYKLLYIV